jgi:hypothetical protein
MNRVPYNKQYGSGPEPTDIRMHPQFPYFKAFYENQVQEMRTKTKVPQQNENVKSEFVPLPTAPTVKTVKAVKKIQAPVERVEQVNPVKKIQAHIERVERVEQANPVKKIQAHIERVERVEQVNPEKKIQAVLKQKNNIPGIGPQMLMSGVPGLGLLQMFGKSKSGGGGQESKLQEIQKRGVVKRNPPLVREDEYLLQQYKHPRIRPDLKLHGMINEQEFQPRAFRESDIPQLNPYALVSDDGSGYELGKLYAYERKSF